MHIPDGFLSTTTSLTFYGLMAPIWYLCLSKLRKLLNQRTIPLVSMLSALSFVIMMINFPLPGGTSGHATGAPLIAILFGPFLASTCLSLILLIQALLFGDGGIITLGANSFCMAFAISISSSAIYQLLNKLKFMQKRWAYFCSAWLSTMLVASLTALILGVQPMLSSDASGRPLHFPFGLSVTLPTMLFSHFFMGIIEGALTVLLASYLTKKNLDVLSPKP